VTGRQQIELRELPEPTPEPGRAVVEIRYCGICGTDLHAYQSGQPYNPATCGHEWVETISGVGAGVDGLREGDRVGIGVPPGCGQCPECRGGDAAHCTRVLMAMLGMGPFAGPHGGFAPSIAVDVARLYPVRRELTDEDAALLEPVTVAIHALRRTPLRLGDAAVVVGAGPIGLLVLQCARIAGAGAVVVVEPEPQRARLAAELGATVVVDPRSESVDERVKEICGRRGPDIVFECAGVPATIDQAVSLVRRGGTMSLVGFATVPAEINPGSWLTREVRVVASLGYVHEEFDVAMQLVADGRLRLKPLCTDTVGLDDLESAFQRLLSGAGDVKLLVDPHRA